MDYRRGTRGRFFVIALAPALMLAWSVRAGAQSQDAAVDLGQISGTVSITAPDIQLGRLLNYVSERTGTTIIADRRFSGISLTVLGGNGPASELLDAVQAATGLQVRRLDDLYLFCPHRLGAAAVAQHHRRRAGPSLTAQRAALAAKANALARQVRLRFWSSGAQPHLVGLTPEQRILFQRRGFLTVADLFPEYYQPMYDILGQMVDTQAQRPASLPEFAGTRVYFYPALQLLLHMPVQASDEQPASAQPQPLTWAIDLAGF